MSVDLKYTYNLDTFVNIVNCNCIMFAVSWKSSRCYRTVFDAYGTWCTNGFKQVKMVAQ